MFITVKVVNVESFEFVWANFPGLLKIYKFVGT